MKQDKNTLYNNRILRCLLSMEVYTTMAIADNVGLSEKTVRMRLKEIEAWLVQNDYGHIQKSRGVGVWLEMNEGQKKRLEAHLMLDKAYLFPVSQLDNRKRDLIGNLLKLKSGRITTLQQLADNLYMSPPTVGGMIKEISYWFEARNLKIVSIRSKGISLNGDEYAFRIAIHDYMIEMIPEELEIQLKLFSSGIDVARIRGIIVDAENAWRIELADNSFKMVWVMVCLSLARRTSSEYGGELLYREENIKNYNEYSFAESIYKRIEYVYQLKIREEDIIFLAVMLLSAKKIKNFANLSEKNYARRYDSDLSEFVRRIIDTIGAVLEVDLSEDTILYESLFQHMRSAIFRMKYSTVTSESISKYVKKEYKQTFLATWSTSHLFEEYYDVQVTEDELAGIVLYIQAAIIRQKKGKAIRALLVTDRGMATSQLTVEMLKYSVPEILDIQVTGFHDFKSVQYPEIDVIINASETEITDKRTVNVGARMDEQGIKAVRQKVAQISRFRKKQEFHFSGLCHELFEVDLLLIRPKVENKEQLIRLMVKKLEDKGDVTSDYLESVLERERATTTSIGHGIAIPHGNMTAVNESRIVVAILDEAISWHDDRVDVVFLLAVKMTTNFEIRRTKQFYKDFLRLTDNEANFTAMKAMNSSLELYQYLIK